MSVKKLFAITRGWLGPGRYPALSWWENHAGGHVNFGPVTIYGENAMHWAVNIRTWGGWFCFRLPLRCFGRWWPLYCYWSIDATPPDEPGLGRWFWGRNLV